MNFVSLHEFRVGNVLLEWALEYKIRAQCISEFEERLHTLKKYCKIVRVNEHYSFQRLRSAAW